MKKCGYYYLYTLLIMCVTTSGIFAQVVQEDSNLVTDTRKKILILSSAGYDLDPNSIEAEVTATVAEIAVGLQRFDVVDRSNLNEILQEQALHQTGLISDSTVISIGNIAASDEALVITVTNFSQVGVPPEDDDDDEDDSGFWESLVVGLVTAALNNDEGDPDDPYPGNIQSQLTVAVKNIDLESGETIGSYNISVSHTGGSRGVSRAEVIDQFKEETIAKLKKLYLLSSEVISVDGNEVLLFLGSNLGVSEGTFFEITQPNEVKNIRGKQITIPGRSSGLVYVADISNETNRSQIARQWGPVKEGYRAVEYTRTAHGVQIFFLPPYPGDYFFIGTQYIGRPLHDFFYGVNVHYSRFTDSYDDKDNGFGLGGFAGQNLLLHSPLRVNGKFGLDLDIPFKTDDADNSVATVIFSATLAVNMSMLVTRKTDIEIDFGYRFTSEVSSWAYTNDEESVDAVWNGPSPKIDIGGFYIMASYKFIIF